METTYRIEQRSREGQILRAEYVDENGSPYTLRTALDDVDATRAQGAANELRIVDNTTNERVDEEEARASFDPGSLAEQWLTSRASTYITSGENAAAALRLLADRMEKVGAISPTWMKVAFQVVVNSGNEEARCSSVDTIAAAVGTYAEPTEMGNGSWHYTSNHHSQCLDAVGVLTSMKDPTHAIELEDAR